MFEVDEMMQYHIENIFNEMIEDISIIKFKLNKYGVKCIKKNK